MIRWVALVAAIASAAAPSAAQPRTGVIDAGILSGRGPDSETAHFARPYFLGWDAQVARPAGLLKTGHEPGGLAADPRTGRVYVAAHDGHLVCLDGGRELWRVEVGGALVAPPTVFEDSVVVGTAQGVLAVLNKVTGERGPRAVLGEELVTQPVVARRDGKLRGYVGSGADSVFGVDLETGRKLWRAHHDQPSPFALHGFARPVLGPGALFAAFADGVVEARDPEEGRVLWERKLSPAGALGDVDALAAGGASLFAASATGGVFALDAATGAIRWREPQPGAGRLAVEGRSLYVVSPGELRALRASDGRVAWSTRFGAGLAGTPVFAQGLVLLAEDDGPLHFVDAATGAPLGLFSTGAGLGSAPAVSGRVAYALSNGGRVYSLSIVR